MDTISTDFHNLPIFSVKSLDSLSSTSEFPSTESSSSNSDLPTPELSPSVSPSTSPPNLESPTTEPSTPETSTAELSLPKNQRVASLRGRRDACPACNLGFSSKKAEVERDVHFYVEHILCARIPNSLELYDGPSSSKKEYGLCFFGEDLDVCRARLNGWKLVRVEGVEGWTWVRTEEVIEEETVVIYAEPESYLDDEDDGDWDEREAGDLVDDVETVEEAATRETPLYSYFDGACENLDIYDHMPIGRLYTISERSEEASVASPFKYSTEKLDEEAMKKAQAEGESISDRWWRKADPLKICTVDIWWVTGRGEPWVEHFLGDKHEEWLVNLETNISK